MIESIKVEFILAGPYSKQLITLILAASGGLPCLKLNYIIRDPIVKLVKGVMFY
jgi:hypothetical protein